MTFGLELLCWLSLLASRGQGLGVGPSHTCGQVLLESIGLFAAVGERLSWRGGPVDVRGSCSSGAQETQVLSVGGVAVGPVALRIGVLPISLAWRSVQRCSWQVVHV